MTNPTQYILLVEDNPGDSDYIKEILDGCEVELSLSVSLADALTQLSTRVVDVVLLDLGLPDGFGVSCVESIRAKATDVPIVVMTGANSESVGLSCISAGAQEYLTKQEVTQKSIMRAVEYASARARELSERRRADALQAQLGTLVEASSDAILVVSLPGLIMYANQTASQLFGLSREDLIGEELGFSISENERKETTISRHGETRLCEIRATKIDWLKEQALYVSLRDITEQRQLESQLAVSDRMIAIGTLAAGVAHEINNPLSAIVLNLEFAAKYTEELAKTTPAIDSILGELQDAREAAERVRQIVLSLKMFSRIEDERREPVDLHRVIDSTVRMAWNEIRHKASLSKDFGEIPFVFANEAKVGQVVLNLIINAAQAMGEGGHSRNKIQISTRRTEQGMVKLSVSDNGAGIPREIQKRLFTAFFTTKPVGVGTGLGLAICQRIVNSFGGEISFESKLNEGTRFDVTLPAAATPTPTFTPAEPVPSILTRSARLLVIDDEPTVLRLVQRTLGDHQVISEQSAQQALARLSNGEIFDLILCDLMMPQMSGADFFQHVKNMNKGDETKIIFMTGGAFTARARAFLDSVPNPCIDKPFQIKSLRDLIHKLLPV